MTSRRNFLMVGAGALTLPASLRSTTAFASDVPPPAEAIEPLAKAFAQALPPTGGILLEDSGSGVARDFYHSALKIRWRGSYQGAVLGTKAVATPGTVRIALSTAPSVSSSILLGRG